jgi:hypothetical protein
MGESKNKQRSMTWHRGSREQGAGRGRGRSTETEGNMGDNGRIRERGWQLDNFIHTSTRTVRYGARVNMLEPRSSIKYQ